MKLARMIGKIDPEKVTGRRDGEVLGLVCDSRQVRSGYLFVAIQGEKRDGAEFAEDAVARGAIGVVSEEPRKAMPGTCAVQVPDARKALAELACHFYGHPSARLRMLGVTGTNGKTTTVFMIRDVLWAHGQKPGLLSTVEYQVGARTIPASRTTPEAPVLQALLAQMSKAGCMSGVMEVSSHALVQKRALGVQYDVGVFTNLTRDHLDYHGTMEAYFEAKLLLFRQLGEKKDAVAVVNLDDEWGRRLAGSKGLPASMIGYGTAPKADVRAEDVQLTSRGTCFRACTPWGRAEIRTRLLGRYNVSNTLATIAACGSQGVPLDLMSRVLEEGRLVPGRLEEVPTGQPFQVFVDYAHTDDALQNVLTTLREITAGRLIAVFGCGGNRDPSKRPAMGEVAARLADYSVVTSDNPRQEDPAEIIAQIREGFGDSRNYETIEDRAEGIRRGLAVAGNGDVILIAGKGHENFQELANTTIPFDDRKVVGRILRGGS